MMSGYSEMGRRRMEKAPSRTMMTERQMERIDVYKRQVISDPVQRSGAGRYAFAPFEKIPSPDGGRCV